MLSTVYILIRWELDKSKCRICKIPIFQYLTDIEYCTQVGHVMLIIGCLLRRSLPPCLPISSLLKFKSTPLQILVFCLHRLTTSPLFNAWQTPLSPIEPTIVTWRGHSCRILKNCYPSEFYEKVAIYFVGRHIFKFNHIKILLYSRMKEDHKKMYVNFHLPSNF